MADAKTRACLENVIWLNLLGRFVVKIGLRCFEPCFVAFDFACVKTEFDADPVSTVVGGTSSTRTPCVGGDNLTVAVSDTARDKLALLPCVLAPQIDSVGGRSVRSHASSDDMGKPHRCER